MMILSSQLYKTYVADVAVPITGVNRLTLSKQRVEGSYFK